VSKGRGWKGCDCWGLARLVYREELGILLPSYADGYADALELRELSRLINGAAASRDWQAVSDVQPFDLLVFRAGQYRTHIAVAVDARRMLHIANDAPAVIARRTDLTWSRRFEGAWRHRGMRA
jgi:cell wall-associated NlpC family hydrolase